MLDLSTNRANSLSTLGSTARPVSAVGLAILWSWRRRLAGLYDAHVKTDKARADAERRGKRKPKK